MRPLGWLLLVGVSACAPALPRPTTEDAAREGMPLERLAQGRDVYVAKCTRCHAAVAPQSRAAEAWVEPVDEMAERARLSPADREAILRYLSAFAKR